MKLNICSHCFEKYLQYRELQAKSVQLLILLASDTDEQEHKVLIQLSKHNLYSDIVDQLWKNLETLSMNTSPCVKIPHKMQRYYTFTVVKTVHTYSVHHQHCKIYIMVFSSFKILS